ncbi:MAG: ABC transporter ATP-binding protein [Alphaproteobacteria bacterium]|nr:ABC transporter ATP-binding protein [Alphaproteobacteria bacterium]
MDPALDADLAVSSSDGALFLLAEQLLRSTGQPVDPIAVGRRVDEVVREHGAASASSWRRLLEALAGRLGLRVSWRACPDPAVAEAVRSDVPAVRWTEAGWTVVRQGLLGPRARAVGEDGRLRTVRLADDGAAHAWALVADPLPGRVLGAEDGRSPWRRLVGLLRAEREDLALVLVYATGAGVLTLATPVAVQVLVNTVAFGTVRQPVLWLGGGLLACLGLAAGLRALQRWVVEVLQRRVFVRMVADLAERLPRVRAEVFDRAHGPELVNRFFDVLTVQKALSSLLLDGLTAGLQAVVGMALLALYHPALLGFDVLLLGAIFLLVLGLGREAPRSAIVESKHKYAVAGWLEEIAAQPALMKLGGGPDLAAVRAERLARSWLQARESHFDAFFRQYAGALALQAVAATVLLVGGGWLVIEQQLTLGQLVAAELVVSQVLIGFAKFSEKLETVYDLLAAVDKLGQLVDLPVDPGAEGRPPSGALGLEVEELGWTDASGRQRLAGLSLALEAGAHAVVRVDDEQARGGLAELLLGLRTATLGTVRLGGVDLRTPASADLRPHLALLRGAPTLAGTVADNVDLGRLDVARSDVEAAVARAGLAPGLEALPGGLDTPLGVGGSPLSADERVRLAVARVLAAEPGLVVVDGLLDGLDPALRDSLWTALTADPAPWTLVVLTREGSLIDRTRRAFTVRDGRLVPELRAAGEGR